MATINTTINTVNQTLIIDVTGVGQLVLRMADVSSECAAYAMLHGFKQRVIDAAALSRDPDTGLAASAQDKFDAMQAIVDHYRTGTADWSVRTPGTGGGSGTAGITIRAVAAVQGTDVETMRARIEALAEKRGSTTKAILAKLAAQPDVARKVAEMKASRGGGDADGMLAELA